MATCQWHGTVQLGEVTKIKTNIFNKFGFFYEGKLWLFPEEILYLMSRGYLRTLCDEIELSQRDMYEILPDCSVSLLCFTAFARLGEMGFIVTRISHPLNKATDLQPTASALDALEQGKPSSGTAPIVYDNASNDSPVFTFIAYPPTARFSRKSPGPIAFYLLICRYQNCVPGVAELLSLLTTSGSSCVDAELESKETAVVETAVVGAAVSPDEPKTDDRRRVKMGVVETDGTLTLFEVDDRVEIETITT